MNIKMTGLHLEITSSLRDYIESKLERICRHVDDLIDISIILSVDKLIQKAEVNVHLSGKDVNAEATDADMYAAIDLVMDKLDRQLLKFKEKQTAHRGAQPEATL